MESDRTQAENMFIDELMYSSFTNVTVVGSPDGQEPGSFYIAVFIVLVCRSQAYKTVEQ